VRMRPLANRAVTITLFSRCLFTAYILGALGCSDAKTAPHGECTADRDRALSCATGDGGVASADFAGYTCTGSARPDEQATYIQDVPQGLICAARGLSETGTQGYCCTATTTDCAYDPVSDCEAPEYGFRCRGSNRPEMLNPLLNCGNGVEEGDLVNYCCAAGARKAGCLQSDAVKCSTRLMGWTCPGDALPRGEELGSSKSRADFYHLLCPMPTPAANPEYNNYCCYMPALVPPAGTCVQNTKVPGCAPGRFGFSCYGPDTPDDDYLPMDCPEPGFAGRSAEGYPATLYCCDFK
jgi:hypothetical protein